VLATRGVHRSSGGEHLAHLFPEDLDAIESQAIVGALGVQLLLFGGFTPSELGWRHSPRVPTTLQERVDLIAPTWKPGGRCDYSWHAATTPPRKSDADVLSLFAPPPALLVQGGSTTVRSLTRALEATGLRASDFDGAARAAIVESLTWRLPASSERLVLNSSGDLTLLVLSFDATAECRSVRDCERPGPTNELLAATAEQFVRRQWAKHAQRVKVIAQWETAAALRALGMHDTLAVGTPGIFENTAQIFLHMAEVMGTRSCGGSRAAGASSQVVLLTHPDHLRRALRIGESAFERLGGPCSRLQLVPAMQPYRLDWPSRFQRPDAMEQSGVAAAGAQLNLYAGVSTRVHTAGDEREATWYDEELGYFPDADPQRWVHRREIWITYEFWARAKGLATGVIARSRMDARRASLSTLRK